MSFASDMVRDDTYRIKLDGAREQERRTAQATDEDGVKTGAGTPARTSARKPREGNPFGQMPGEELCAEVSGVPDNDVENDCAMFAQIATGGASGAPP